MAKKAKGRGKSWCPGSVELMLDHIHELMPAGSNGWDEVAAKFNAGPYPFRDAEGIKRKFYTLRNHAMPTGDPSCPVDAEGIKRKFYTLRNHAKPTGDPPCWWMSFGPNTSVVASTPTVLTMEDDEDDMDDDGHGDGNDYASEQVEMNEVPLPASRHERPSRSGMGESELAMLGSRLKRAASAPPSGGITSYVAKKRQSIDTFIDGAMVSDAKASSDMMSMMMLMDERAAQREEKRLDKELEWRQQQQEREERPDGVT
ncbi:hypothetical protein DYB28_003539 [Aphanomyces astaci]|uniref:Uncharacterized protein n=1 Tax=Aphanomyces astaci TaxID=112090 RepID=A0A9X8E553_APHAT|nr:hypothetical protein DYB28_003539 [Aphanomyces astaci]